MQHKILRSKMLKVQYAAIGNMKNDLTLKHSVVTINKSKRDEETLTTNSTVPSQPSG